VPKPPKLDQVNKVNAHGRQIRNFFQQQMGSMQPAAATSKLDHNTETYDWPPDTQLSSDKIRPDSHFLGTAEM
jgi:hypothetical protein